MKQAFRASIWLPHTVGISSAYAEIPLLYRQRCCDSMSPLWLFLTPDIVLLKTVNLIR